MASQTDDNSPRDYPRKSLPAPYRAHNDNMQPLEAFFRALAAREKLHGALPVIAKTGNIPSSYRRCRDPLTPTPLVQNHCQSVRMAVAAAVKVSHTEAIATATFQQISANTSGKSATTSKAKEASRRDSNGRRNDSCPFNGRAVPRRKPAAAHGRAEGFDWSGRPRDIRLQGRRLVVLHMRPSHFSHKLRGNWSEVPQ